jgi:hypothetical protein
MVYSYPVAGFTSPRQASAKVAQLFSSAPVLEHIAETRPSSSEFIAGNRTRRCESVITIATRGIVTVLASLSGFIKAASLVAASDR